MPSHTTTFAVPPFSSFTQSTSVAPVYMFTGEAPRPGEPRRAAYARILTSDRQFARATVNYLWKEMFGIGIVEPVNAFDLARLDPNKLPSGQTLQPTNSKLLEDLTDNFIASGYNLRTFLRTMAISNSYQLASKYTPGTWNESWTTYFARHYPRRLSAEMLLDAVTKSTNVPATLQVQGIGALAKAMALPDTIEPGPRSQFGLSQASRQPGRNELKLECTPTSARGRCSGSGIASIASVGRCWIAHNNTVARDSTDAMYPWRLRSQQGGRR